MSRPVFDVCLQSVHVEDEDSVNVRKSGHAKVLPGQQDEAEDKALRRRAEPTVSQGIERSYDGMVCALLLPTPVWSS